MFGQAYEQCQPRQHRKAAGVFYTPESIVEYMLQKTVAQTDLLQNPFPRILDPSCGCGYFLTQCYHLLHGMFEKALPGLQNKFEQQSYLLEQDGNWVQVGGNEYWQRGNLAAHILSNCLFGTDIDANAVALARQELVRQSGIARAERLNLLVVDSLSQETSAVPWLSGLWPEAYDYVIGNPPYVSYGLRGVGKITQEQYALLIRQYPNSAEYKISLYALFYERGMRLLKAGGQLAYITPDSFLTGKYFGKLRHYLASRFAINSITLLGFDAFPEAKIGRGIVTVITKTPPDNNQVAVRLAGTEQELSSGLAAMPYVYEQKYFQVRFPIFFNKDEHEIYDTMQSFGEVFSAHCRVYSGCIARYGQNSIVADAPLTEYTVLSPDGGLVWQDRAALPRWRPLLAKGACIGQYCIKPSGRYIYIHENPDIRKLYAKSGFDLTRYQGEKLFLRQTGASLVAAYDQTGYFCLNNMHVISARGDKVSLKVLLALLNSRLYNFYYRMITREENRVMAQIDIDVIKELPLIPVKKPEQVAGWVDELTAAYSEYLTAGAPMPEKINKQLQERRRLLEEYLLLELGLNRSIQAKILGQH